MINITVKNIPKKLHEILKRRAALSRRSLNNEIIANLEAVVGISALNETHMLQDARSFQNVFKGEAHPEEMDRLKRQGRA